MPEKIERPIRVYQPHETARMQELAGLELASFASRACALGIDFVLASAIFLGWFAVLIKLGAVAILKRIGLTGDYHLELDYEHWYGILYFVLYFGLSVYIGNGKTLGKWLMRIRVVSIVHRRMSLWHSVERALGYGASTLELGFGFLQYFIHPNRRTVHDRMAETIVIRDPRPARPSADGGRGLSAAGEDLPVPEERG
jgi:uncharacterized RDD family membrane protein YckC